MYMALAIQGTTTKTSYFPLYKGMLFTSLLSFYILAGERNGLLDIGVIIPFYMYSLAFIYTTLNMMKEKGNDGVITPDDWPCDALL